jgi:predicted dehydrogenase
MPIRLAVAGLTHGHVWGLLEQWAAQPEVELVAVADPTPLLDNARARFQRAYVDWQRMLDAESPDVVLACADNRTSAAIAIAAMQRNGAGALADFACYGAVMSAYLLGEPLQVLGVRGNLTKDYPISDDNAVLIARYPKAIAVIEATWSQIGADGAPNPIVYGTEATAGVIDGKLRIHRRGAEPTLETPPPLPEGKRNAPEYFLKCLRTGARPEGVLSPEIALIAQRMVEMVKQ